MTYAVSRHDAVPYSTPAHREEPLLLDLVVPATGAPAPVVIWLHGGGWWTGDRTLAPNLEDFAAETGLAFASLDYRLSGEEIFPAAWLDLRAAIRWLAANAAEYGLDGGRIATWGSSAGGHLAVLSGVTGHLPLVPGEGPDVVGQPLPRLAAAAAGYPPVDLTTVVENTPAERRAGSPEARFLGGLPEERPEAAAAASPLTYIAEATATAPPFHLAHGEQDSLVPVDQSVRLAEALTNAGIPVELAVLPGYNHGFLNPPGRPDVPTPAALEEGRLMAEEPTPATWTTDGEPTPERTTYAFADALNFLKRTLSA
ncbi:MAG: alpha/beta hydrolase fold domain-containing protein [Galactobacter sp.]